MVKAIAAMKGWDYQQHKHLFAAVSTLARDNQGRDIRRLFHIASSLHNNFYENWLNSDDVADGLDDMERFVSKMERILVSHS